MRGKKILGGYFKSSQGPYFHLNRKERVRDPGSHRQPVGGGSSRRQALSGGDPDGAAPLMSSHVKMSIT